jgi:hypothetical protein
MRRSAPVVALFLIAPFVAEFLLGNLSITVLSALVVLAPLYGGGAVLVREAVCRAGRGWPSLLVLGLAFGLLEEAFLTQSLFNPDYLGLKLNLLAPAHVRFLGLGVWWTVFVLTLHAVWSIATSIALGEALFPERAKQPWLGRVGLVVTTVLFVFGCVATAAITHQQDSFLASPAQLGGAALAMVLLLFGAFHLRPPRSNRAPGGIPHPWLVGFLALAAGTLFLMVPPTWGWFAVAAYLALDLAVLLPVIRWSRRQGWGALHELALAGGAAGAYACHAFPQQPVVGARGTADLVGNTVFAVILAALLGLARVRIRRAHP